MKYLFEHEEKSLLDSLKDSKSAIRDYMIIDLILNTGLRLNETSKLIITDIKKGIIINSHLNVRKEIAKRSKAREIPLNKNIRKHLKEYLQWKIKQNEPIDLDKPLFLSRHKLMISNRQVERIIKKWMDKAGLIGNGYTVHSLRHTFAMKLRRRGIGLERIQKLLGHSSLSSTGIYIEPSKESLLEAVESLTDNFNLTVAFAQNL